MRENKNAEAVAVAMEALAKRKGTALTSVAIAYVLHKAPYVFPICGGRSLEQLKGNIEAVGLDLDEGDMEEIESAAPFELGFPFNLIGTKAKDNHAMNQHGIYDYVEDPRPVRSQRVNNK